MSAPVHVPAPLIVWAVEVSWEYGDTFVDSLWLTKELADIELARLREQDALHPTGRTYDVAEWSVGETPTTFTEENPA